MYQDGNQELNHGVLIYKVELYVPCNSDSESSPEGLPYQVKWLLLTPGRKDKEGKGAVYPSPSQLFVHPKLPLSGFSTWGIKDEKNYTLWITHP